ncbi:MAG: hypothetical protein QOE77_3305 [Blastocatellia bacterium]|jgi:hypothetical protein|nr:hypothetical protein [Blastocatellia bacterium]
MARLRKNQSPERFKLSVDLSAGEYKDLLKLRNALEKESLKSDDEWHIPITVSITLRAALTTLTSKDLERVLIAIRELDRKSRTARNQAEAADTSL